MNFNLSRRNRALNLKFRRFMKTKGFASVLIGALFECDRTYRFKRTASTRERLFTVICAVANFLYLCLLLIHSAALAYVLYAGSTQSVP